MSKQEHTLTIQQALDLALQNHNAGRLKQTKLICYQVLQNDPNQHMALHLLGMIEHQTGKLENAVASYHKVLNIKPDYAEAHNNLGVALQHLGKVKEAATSYENALAIRPDFTDALGNYGILHLALGHRQEALICFNKTLRLVRGPNPSNPNLESFCSISKAKMKHDIEQLQYLESLGIDVDRFKKLARIYLKLDQEIEWPPGDSMIIPLTTDQRKHVGSSYNRPIHLVETPEIPGYALNQNLDKESITQNYIGNPPGMAFFDNFLNPDALHALRRFLLESTIWYKFNYSAGYIGAMLVDGMACPLLFQIADELCEAFPDIFKDHKLNQLWAYKYDSKLTGINVHADSAAINVNFWITPDYANLNPNKGGLVIYKEEAPLDWNFDSYNRGHQEIRQFLAEHDSQKLVIPYAENRVVLFNSDLFHETDTFEFKPGYENRRINVTMLFGNRWD